MEFRGGILRDVAQAMSGMVAVERLPPETPFPPSTRRAWWTVAIVLIAAAFAIRASQFGNPRIHVDETFYLLVGDRMLHWGWLPYVDIWDRKPIGLFLIFAATRLLGGAGFVQYQVVATLFAAATAILIARIAWRMATPFAAAVAGILYLLLLGAANGMGGQAPVFYNLFVAGAALLTLRAWEDPARVQFLGAGAMLLMGIAMQVKYTAVFEGMFFGLLLTWLSWRARRRMVPVLADAALWVALALAPTIAAWLYYVARGAGDAFVYANFLSIGGRADATAAELLKRLGKTWNVLHLPVFCVLLSLVLAPWRRFAQGPRAFGFVMMWLGAALAGYALFGTYFDHYALPLLVPIAVAAAPLFGHRPYRIGLVAAVVMLVAGSTAYAMLVRHNTVLRGGAAAADAMVAAIRPRLGGGCLYVFDGDASLYYQTNACIPTRYAFPSHLNLLREAGAIGVDQLAELRRIMATKPTVVVDTQTDRPATEENPVPVAAAHAALARDYRLVATVPAKRTRTLIYERLPGH